MYRKIDWLPSFQEPFLQLACLRFLEVVPWFFTRNGVNTDPPLERLTYSCWHTQHILNASFKAPVGLPSKGPSGCLNTCPTSTTYMGILYTVYCAACILKYKHPYLQSMTPWFLMIPLQISMASHGFLAGANGFCPSTV